VGVAAAGASLEEATSRRGLRAGPLLLTLPAVVGLLLVFIAPFAVFGAYSLLTPDLFTVSTPWTTEAYRTVVDTDVNRTLARNSLVVGVLSAAISVAVALPIAYWLRYAAGRWRLLVLFLIVGSMFASYLVRIYAWRSILGTNGLLNSGLASLGLIDEPIGFLLYSRFAVVVALVHIFLPYVVLVLYAGFSPVPASLIEAAQDLGANALQRWARVILPVIAAPAASAFLFVFVLSAADYVTPQFLGGSSGGMLGVQIQANFITTGNWSVGAATAIVMLLGFVLAFALVAVGLRLLRLNALRFAA
jgi:spermidine/putrescine transport system permease protein